MTCAPPSTRSARCGVDVPVINWRYILFNWNDNDREMAAGPSAGRRDRASIACAGRSPITPSTRSRAGSRRAPTDHAAIRHEIWDDNNLGNAIPGATPRARIEVRGAPADATLYAAPGETAPHRHARPQPVAAALPRHRHLRPPPRAPRRAAGDADGAIVDRDCARALLPAPGGRRRQGRRRRSTCRCPRSPAATPCASTWSAKASTGSSPAAPSPPSASWSWARAGAGEGDRAGDARRGLLAPPRIGRAGGTLGGRMRLLPILLAALAAAPVLGAQEAGRPGSSSWPTASPESQGFDSRSGTIGSVR